jgi:Zn-finger nucleic acid-binding protein
MTICAWCGVVLKPDKPKFVSHGMCPKCQVAFLGGPGPVSLKEYIERFKFPVILVNSNVELKEANQAALKLVGKDPGEVRSQLVGEVMECIHASQPGGCGRTVHCQACTIRNSVKATFESGIPLIDVDAYQEIVTEKGLQRVRLKISTVKASESVLIKIVAA